MNMDSKIRATGWRLHKLNFFLWRGPSARRKLVHQRRFICLGWLLCGLLAGVARADTFQLNDGSTLTGDVVSYDENSLRVRLPDGNYSNPVGWTNFSQADLKKFAQDPKMEKFASQYVEVTEEQRIQKTEVTVTQPHRLKHPASSSLFGAMLSSSVGLFVIVLLYAAGIYAAYEVALFRRRPPALVCGMAAIPGLGFLSPIIFLSVPTQARAGEEEVELHEGEVAAPAEAPAFTGTCREWWRAGNRGAPHQRRQSIPAASSSITIRRRKPQRRRPAAERRFSNAARSCSTAVSLKQNFPDFLELSAVMPKRT